MRGWICGLAIVASSCAASNGVATVEQSQSPRWVAVLAAGDDSLPVFDNATSQIAALLRSGATPASNIQRLSAATAPGVPRLTRSRLLDAISHMDPAPGQSCLVFITSHGAHALGVFLAPQAEFLTPDLLDAALQRGCGSAPTVAIVSACYTGNFAAWPMTRPNRIVLTAAKADRPSFGCGADRFYTYYDGCLISSMTSLPRDWQDIISGTGECVARLEEAENETPSEPQSYVGRQATALPLPGG